MAAPFFPTRVPELSLCAEKHQVTVHEEAGGRRSLISRERNTQSTRTTENTGQQNLLASTPSKTSTSSSSLPKEKPKPRSNKMRTSLNGIQETAPSVLESSERGKNPPEKELKELKLAPMEDRQARRRAELTRQTILSDYGLQESWEIPKHLYVNILSEIVKIERQLREEKILMEIRKSRERREIKKQSDALREAIKLSARTALPGFSYFPDVPNHVTHPGPYTMLNEAKVNKRRVRVHQEKTVKKMSLFYQRHRNERKGI